MQVNVAGLRRNIKNLAHNYSDAQVKVREATSNDPWGPSATIMAEVADLTYNHVAFPEIMQMIWKRLNDHGKNWRHVYKALILLEYLIKTGSEKVAQQCKENFFAIQTLREFMHHEEGKDQGTHVREKAKQLVILLRDEERLKNERIKALKAKERFAQHPSGFGSDGYIDGPLQRDMPPGWQEEPPKSELEMVRPQTAGEEELQLQLAMAMSREEAEQEEAKRRSDDVRLQLALSQSEQDFKKDEPVPPRREEPQSHLLDLLEISMGASSISSPPLGAAGGMGAGGMDPWGGAAGGRAVEPWSNTSSPQVDPWHPTAAPRYAALVPMGGTNGDAWAMRTQSPSVASGSSTEGWLQNNSAASMNGNHGLTTATIGVDPWLSKSVAGPALSAQATGGSLGSADAWLTEGASKPAPAARTALLAVDGPQLLPLDDPWAPKADIGIDPWNSLEASGTKYPKKPSPDMDEFDIITNRNKSGDLINNGSSNYSNNNNASLLDEMDPLSSTHLNMSSTLSGTTNGKRPLKDPQSFLGENSALVNLDNLIKPVAPPQPQVGSSAAYNPFSDSAVPPKTNLFQQQQPAVPSINQLKQQQPFAMTMNQDPWAPVANAQMTSQYQQKSAKSLFSCDDDDDTDEFNLTPTPSQYSIRPNGRQGQHYMSTTAQSACDDNNNSEAFEQNRPIHLLSDYDTFDLLSHDPDPIAFTPHSNPKNNTAFAASSYNPNNAFASIAYNATPLGNTSCQYFFNSDVESTHYNSAFGASTEQQPQKQQDDTTPINYTSLHAYATSTHNSNSNMNSNNMSQQQQEPAYGWRGTVVAAPTTPSAPPFGAVSRYSSELIDSLASMPGVRVSASRLAMNEGAMTTAPRPPFAAANFRVENQNNNNMPWIKPEAAASNPFLS